MSAKKPVGDSTGVNFHGYLNIVDGRSYIDCIPVDVAFKQFAGAYVYIELIRPDPARYTTIDSEIAPLVDAINAVGAHTLGCCQGHMEPVWYGEEIRCPYVDFVAEGELVRGIGELLPHDWEMQPWGNSIYEIRPVADAASEDELIKMRTDAKALAVKIRQAIA